MSKATRQATDLYESFREASPKKLLRLTLPDIPKIVACMGRVEYVGYRTTHGKKLTLYQHDFVAGSRPLMCVSKDGRQILLVGGRYHFTDRGIVDLDSRGRERPDPKHGAVMRNTRRKNPSVITPTHHEKMEWARMAGWATKAGRLDAGHRYSAAAATGHGQPLSVAAYDALQGPYREWLNTNKFPAGDQPAPQSRTRRALSCIGIKGLGAPIDQRGMQTVAGYLTSGGLRRAHVRWAAAAIGPMTCFSHYFRLYNDSNAIRRKLDGLITPRA